MNYDNTLDLTKSTGWIKSTKPIRIEDGTLSDGSTRVFIRVYEVKRDPNAPIVTDHEEYNNLKLKVHEHLTLRLKHQVGIIEFEELEIHYTCYYADGDPKKRCYDLMPFRVKNKKYTYHFKRSIEMILTGFGLTLKHCACICHTTPYIVKEINKERIKRIAGDMRPTLADNVKHIAIDEFLLHKGHKYVTIVIDADNGRLLYLEQDKGKRQLEHFFRWVGDAFMRNVETISMDMNATYSNAVKDAQWKYPNLKIVYDKFHLIKMYNDLVISGIRKRLSRELKKEAAEARKNGDEDKAIQCEDAAKDLWSCRMLLLANLETLKAKDLVNGKMNDFMDERAKNDKLNPYKVFHKRVNNVERLKKILEANSEIQNVCRMRQDLQEILDLNDENEFKIRLHNWIIEARSLKIAELDAFADTVIKRKEGIITRAKYKVNSNRMEGINGMIKALRRMSFGLPEFDYFAYLIWEQCYLLSKRIENARKTQPKSNATKKNKTTKITKATIRDWKDKTVFDYYNNPAPDCSPLWKKKPDEELIIF